jgi:trimethylamine:corrinoid methyltransferase-like protein
VAAEGIVRSFKPLEILTEEQVERIHQSALDILDVTGVRIDSERALKIYKKDGSSSQLPTGPLWGRQAKPV